MKMELEVELRDVPGQLSFVLDRVSEHGGNIDSVLHRRADARGEWVPVKLVLEIAPARAHRLVDALREKVRVLAASGEAKGLPMPLMLVGHVFDNRVDEFLEVLHASGCRIHRVQAEMTSKEAPSAVFIDLTADSDAGLQEALRQVEAMARERGLSLLRGLPEVAT